MIVEEWNKYLDLVNDSNKTLYSTEEYCNLYDDEINKSKCFIYHKGENFFIFPFLSQEIKQMPGYFDFETHYGYGGPIVKYIDSSFIEDAWDTFREELFEKNYISGFIRFNPLLNNQKFISSQVNTFYDRKTIAIDLTPSEDDIWLNEIHAKHRNVIKKAESFDLEFIVDFDFNYLDDFKSLYDSTMNRLNASDFYIFSDVYYDNFIYSFKSQAFLAIVKKDDLVISAAIIMFDKKYGHYHLAGSNADYLRMYPNNFMLYKTALFLKSLEIDFFHLGGGTTSDEQDSLYKFKKRFNKLNDKLFYIGKFMVNKRKYDEVISIWENSGEYNENNSGLFLKYRY